MNILFISRQGDGAPIAEKFQQEGHSVRMWIKKNEKREGIYDGIVPKIENYEPSVPWCDYAYVDHTGLADIAEKIRKSKPVFGGSKEAEDVEKERTKAHEQMKELGILCPESVSFKTVDEVKAHIKEHKIKHVIKPVGPKCESDDVFVSRYEDGKDILVILERMKEEKKQFEYIEVEEKIDGIEAGVAAYCDGTKFSEWIEINFQMKPFATGNNGKGIGFATGEMGTLTKMVRQDNPFFQKTLAKRLPFLKKINYRGEIDMGFIVNPKGAYYIEDTDRKGYPDCVIRWETQKTKDSELSYEIANGNLQTYECLPEWAIGVVVVCPGFADHKNADKQAQGLPIFGYEENKDHCRLFGAMKKKIDGKEMYVVSGDSDGYPGVITGHGKTIEEAMRNVYWLRDERNPNMVDVPKSWHRVDVGERVLKQKEKIIQLGILTQEEFDGQS